MELWIARELGGSLYAYREKPQRGLTCFLDADWSPFFDDMFPEVTWENSPRKVTLTLVEEPCK